ncbi:cell wall-active antibiotics response protein LiaF [Aquibacillus sediminis]|uniref:cell wall-active antibiotics response protein LiaF n=1 Tax=Aquibacillus sediminis TaxID=2574734 RepID=UPI0014873756|nr:cell wall-active antibiotics response protein LiaF [Aquibacillus sediminis]
MDKRNSTDIVHILLFAMVVLFVFELIFINMGHLVSILIWLAFIYYGKKRYSRMRGKVLFWLGVFLLTVTILNTLAFKFLLFILIVYLIVKWYKAKQEPTYMQPEFSVDEHEGISEEPILFTNKWFGQQRTKRQAYEWKDVNIQSGVGDTVIDLSYTVIPKSDPVVVVRHLVGNVQIVVPYDVEVSVHHSSLFGSVDIFDYHEQHTWNRVVHLQSENYQQATKRVRIFTSVLVGKIEVKRG